MGRMYRAAFDRVAVAAVQDLFEVVAPSDATVRILEIHVTGTLLETSEQLAIRGMKGYTTSGSGGSSVTPPPVSTGDAAFGGTVEVNNTTVANTGSPTTEFAEGFNALTGFHFVPKPGGEIEISPSARFVVHLPVAPSGSTTMSGYVLFEEIGG